MKAGLFDFVLDEAATFVAEVEQHLSEGDFQRSAYPFGAVGGRGDACKRHEPTVGDVECRAVAVA